MENTVENGLPSTSHTIHAMHTARARGRERFSLGVNSAFAENEAIDGLEELLHKTWTIFGVSTLFNFHQDELHLKLYAKRLREEIASKLAQEDVAYSTEFYVLENITTSTDSSPIKIEVYAEKNINQESTKKCIYTGILLSWKSTENESTTSNSTRLPLLLCRGTQGAIKSVQHTLNMMFDCMIIALPMQEDDLMWLAPIVITPINKELPKSTDEIHMEYRIPELPPTDTITIKFQIVDLIKILTVIIKDQNDEASGEICFHLEHIEKFRKILYTQTLEAAGLQLGFCTLHKINLPALAIMGNRMKVMNTDAMNRVLLYLNEKALNTFHMLSFEI